MNIDDIIENAQLKGRVIALEGQVQTLDAEVKCLEAVIRAHERVDCLSVTSLKKQLVEADAENARLKAECQARQAENSVLAVECDSLKAEVERLTKMCQATSHDGFIHIRDIKHLNAAKGGKQS
jgi:cell division protein FtsB